MALDEFLFAKASNYFRRSKGPSDAELERTVKLDDYKEKLTLIARAVTGNPISIFHAEREGGYKNNSFFLPSSCILFSTAALNYQYYIFRVLYLSVQSKLNLNWNNNNQESTEIAQQKARESSVEILTTLAKEYPVTLEWHQLFIKELQLQTKPNQTTDTTWLYGKWMLNTIEPPTENTLQHFNDQTKQAQEEKILTTLKAKAIEEVISIEVDKKQQEDYVLTHNFEKVDTAEEFDGVWRDFDGDDDLKAHENALDELNMKFTVRVDDTTHSVYQADFIENTTISESAERDEKGYHLSYDEWDYSKNIYKDNYCKIYPVTQLKTDIPYYQKTVAQHATTLIGLRKMLANINNKMQQQRRQIQGDEFDTDAITDLFVDVHSQHTPSDKLYISKRKKEKDLSILVLLDMSLSSDGYADGNRIIDVEKQVSILFGEILNEYNVDFSISGFYSKTRNYATFLTLKEFEDDWNRAKNVIGAIEPNGYTRIGVALRHAGALLQKRPTKNKWVVLISDGKPNDYDKYEGKYGIQDVKQALRELHEKQVNAYALAIEAQAKYYLPQMFGQNHYQILTKPTELLQSLVKLYEKIKHQ